MFRFIALLAAIVAVAAFAPSARCMSRLSNLKMANIVETAVAAGSFKTLVAAVTAAGLGDALSGKGPLTVFAPTDAAFAKLPAGTVEALLKDIPKLKSILTYHVVGRECKPTRNGLSFETLNGKELSSKVKVVTVSAMKSFEEYYVYGGQTNPAKVETLGIKCDNGLIHVIDEVLLPYEGSEAPQHN